MDKPGATPLMQRMVECPLRRERGCGEIDTALGWTHALGMASCDACWKLGGPGSSDAADHRDRITCGILQSVTVNLAAHHPRVVRAVIERHSTPAEAAERRALLDRPRQKAPPRMVRWMGRDWRGYPWPKRPFVAAWTGLRAAWNTWKALGRTGCGCDDRCKSRVERVAAALAGAMSTLCRRRRPT